MSSRSSRTGTAQDLLGFWEEATEELSGVVTEELVGILASRLADMDLRFFEGAKAFWGMKKTISMAMHSRLLSQWPDYEARRNQNVSVRNQLKQYFHHLLTDDHPTANAKSVQGSRDDAAGSGMETDGSRVQAAGLRRKSTDTTPK